MVKPATTLSQYIDWLFDQNQENSPVSWRVKKKKKKSAAVELHVQSVCKSECVGARMVMAAAAAAECVCLCCETDGWIDEPDRRCWSDFAEYARLLPVVIRDLFVCNNKWACVRAHVRLSWA